MKKIIFVLSLMGVCTLYSTEKPVQKVKPLIPGKELEVLGISNINNIPMNLASAIRELVTGVTDPYFGDELFNKISEMQKKVPSGEYVEHWDNGQLKVKGSFKNGLADGHIHGWYKDGRDAFKGFYKEGKKAGIHIAFFPEEFSRHSEEVGRVLSYDSEGKLDGEQITSYSDGRLHTSIMFKNGLLHGETIVYTHTAPVGQDGDNKTALAWSYKKGKLVKGASPTTH